MVRRTRWACAAFAVLAVVAAACGDNGGTNTSATTTPSGGASTTAAGGTNGNSNCKVSRPVNVVALVEKPPEGPNAIPDFAEGYDLAQERIGTTVCGQSVNFSRIAASPTDGNQAKNAYLQALDKKADVVLGLVSDTAVYAVAPQVKQSGVPILYASVAEQAAKGGTGFADSGFIIRPSNSGIAIAQVDYFVKTLGKKNIGLLCVNVAFGTQGCDAAQKQIEADGGKVVGRETNETTDTDLTAKVIALKNANPDAVITFTFPNNLVVFYNQAATNGLNVPIQGNASAGLIINGVNQNARANVWGTDDCVPVSDPAQKDWVAAYEKKFNKKMTGSGYNIAESYDSYGLALKAIETANSLDSKAISDALRSLTYNGVCTTYKSDSTQRMNHAAFITQYDANGIAQVKQKIDIPPK